MDAERLKFCEQTIETIEKRVTLLLDWINENSTSAQDDRTSKAIKNLVGARAALLCELESTRRGA